MQPKKIVFLYSEIASYSLACFKALAQHTQLEIHLVRWQVNKEAPFEFDMPKSIHQYIKNDLDRTQLTQLIKKINPNLIFASGWIDPDYVTICKQYRKKIPVVAGLDNQWKGTWRQRLACVFSPFTVQKYFTHLWVTGKPQQKYAQKLGFKSQNILYGFYAADVPFFNELYTRFLIEKQQNLPKRFIFVGRYIEVKGIKELWNAFVELQTQTPNDWQLWCIGTGIMDNDNDKFFHEKIKHIGFVQPNEIDYYIKNTSVFILPSYFEPWGVVVQEFAAAGFPLLCSKEVGAASEFLENNQNGYTFEAKSTESIKQAMKKIMALTDSQLLEMGNQSNQKAQHINPTLWAKTLTQLL